MEARLNGKYWFNDEILLKGYLVKGLANGSPEFGMGMSVYYSF